MTNYSGLLLFMHMKGFYSLGCSNGQQRKSQNVKREHCEIIYTASIVMQPSIVNFLHVGGVDGVHVVQLLADPANVSVRCFDGPLDQSLLNYDSGLELLQVLGLGSRSCATKLGIQPSRLIITSRHWQHCKHHHDGYYSDVAVYVQHVMLKPNLDLGGSRLKLNVTVVGRPLKSLNPKNPRLSSKSPEGRAWGSGLAVRVDLGQAFMLLLVFFVAISRFPQERFRLAQQKRKRTKRKLWFEGRVRSN